MGFLSGLGRLLSGKPVFQDPGSSPHFGAWGAPASSDTPTDTQGHKIIPEVRIEHCQTHFNGNSTMVTAWATNTSEGEIELDKVVILDAKQELDRRLGPSQSHEIVLYKGPVPMSDSSKKAQLYYRLVSSDDNFRADFLVEYNRQSDGSFMVEDLHPDHPVHDI